MDNFQLALTCLILTTTAVMNARIFWLVKYQKEDPLKVVQPWWIKNQDDKEVLEAFNNRG